MLEGGRLGVVGRRSVRWDCATTTRIGDLGYPLFCVIAGVLVFLWEQVTQLVYSGLVENLFSTTGPSAASSLGYLYVTVAGSVIVTHMHELSRSGGARHSETHYLLFVGCVLLKELQVLKVELRWLC